MEITLYNDFHGTAVSIRAQGDKLLSRQVITAKYKLCGVKGCTCSGPLGIRGEQDARIQETDRGFYVRDH